MTNETERDIEKIQSDLYFAQRSDIRPYRKYNKSGSKLWNIKRMHPLNKRKDCWIEIYPKKSNGTYDFKLEMSYIGAKE